MKEAKNEATERDQLNQDERRTYDFCRRMGDSHALAMKAVEIKRAKPDNREFYRNAYEA